MLQQLPDPPRDRIEAMDGNVEFARLLYAFEQEGIAKFSKRRIKPSARHGITYGPWGMTVFAPSQARNDSDKIAHNACREACKLVGKHPNVRTGRRLLSIAAADNWQLLDLPDRKKALAQRRKLRALAELIRE